MALCMWMKLCGTERSQEFNLHPDLLSGVVWDRWAQFIVLPPHEVRKPEGVVVWSSL